MNIQIDDPEHLMTPAKPVETSKFKQLMTILTNKFFCIMLGCKSLDFTVPMIKINKDDSRDVKQLTVSVCDRCGSSKESF